jgi:hypothetical protein
MGVIVASMASAVLSDSGSTGHDLLVDKSRKLRRLR